MQTAIGRGDAANVGADDACAAETLELTLLQDAMSVVATRAARSRT